MAKHHPHLRRIYELKGEIASSWSEVEVLWFLIFTAIMEKTPREQATAVFFMFETSAKQRDLIKAVADATYPKDRAGRKHPTRKRIGQLIAATNDAAGNRNAAIHANITTAQSMASILKGEYYATPGMNPGRPSKLAGKSLEDELSKTVSEIAELINNLHSLRDHIAPKLEVSPELIAGLRKLGLLGPSWIIETQTDQVDPQATPPPQK